MSSALPRGTSGDYVADRILGKPDFSEVNPYTTVADKLWLPHLIQQALIWQARRDAEGT